MTQRNLRFSDEQDRLLESHAKRLGIPVLSLIRLFVEQGMSEPSKDGTDDADASSSKGIAELQKALDELRLLVLTVGKAQEDEAKARELEHLRLLVNSQEEFLRRLTAALPQLNSAVPLDPYERAAQLKAQGGKP